MKGKGEKKQVGLFFFLMSLKQGTHKACDRHRKQ